MADETRVTHDRLAARLDLTIASISRIRAGKRKPSLEVMSAVAKLFGWELHLQAEARTAGRYADEFNQRAEKWGSENPAESVTVGTDG